ncbi:MAG: sodium:solute symporter, partial [Clostridia bacterium]|nr:sodium:solute symporter [Clostridia bacterium]
MTFWIVFSVMFFMLAAVLYIYCTRNTFNTLDGFITARHTLSTGPAVATIFASIMGAWILFAPAEAGTWGGLTAFMGYAVAQALVVVAFAIFGPRLRYLAPNCSTLPEFVFYRYGRGMYILTLIVSMFYMAVF